MIARALFLAALMVSMSAVSASVKSPHVQINDAPDLEKIAPVAFGDWREVELSSVVLPAELELGPGEAVLYRAYRDDAGRLVTLVAAYGPPLGDSVRLHRPESCYVAQGFAVERRTKSPLTVGEITVPVIRMDTAHSLRREAVSYWLRDGNSFAQSAADHQLLSLRRGIAERVDGALVRVSSPGGGDAVYEIHRDFLKDFVGALSEDGRRLFLGGA